MIWLKFVGIQLLMLLATVAGWFILLPWCIAHGWSDWDHQPSGSVRLKSIKDGRMIDQWGAPLLRLLYNNPEDGVSGQQALVWLYGTTQGPYMPDAPAWWRAYCWSALRNSCDNLKYVFEDPIGPLRTFKLFGRTCRIGWQPENGYNVPVLSL